MWTKLSLVILAVLTWAHNVSTAAVRPHSGDLYYNGNTYADSYFGWWNPGPWTGNVPGYEHDLRLGTGLFGACTSFTNLPHGYDDCVTAGWSDPPGYIIFAFGSYRALQIQAGVQYYGGWNFSQPQGQAWTTVDLWAQNVEHYFCNFDWPWCMNGVSTTNLIPPGTYTMNLGGIPTIVYW